MVRSHCKIHHPKREAPSPLKQNESLQALMGRGLKSSTSQKYTQPPGQKPVDGLEVLNGYLCPLHDLDGARCSKAFFAISSFVRHLSSHPDHPKPDPTLCKSPIQTLFAQGSLQMYFAVEPSLSLPDPPLSSAYADALTLLHSLPVPQVKAADNDKERASIHWFTRWPELLEPYCKDDGQASMLRSLVSFPEERIDPEWLIRVQDHGCRWWTKAELAHVNCSYRASVLLKSHQEYVSPDLVSSTLTERSVRYSGHWKVLREEDSARRYCGTAISLVSFCLRTVDLPLDKVPIRFTDRQKDVLSGYRQYLMTTTTPSAGDVDAFHQVLSAVLFRDKELEIDFHGKLACPVQSFLAFLSIRSVGEFVKAGLVTQPISRLLYVSRGSVLLTALKEASGADDRRFIRCVLTSPLLRSLNFTHTSSILEETCSNLLGTGEGKVSDELISLRKYASSLAMQEPGYLRVLYDPDYTTLSHRGRNMSLAKLQHGLNKLISDTWERLLALSGGTELSFDVPVGMSEDILSETPGYSFINKIRGGLPTLSLLREMAKHPKFSLFRPSTSGSGRKFDLDPSSVCEFLHTVKPIVESIAFLLHATGSGPLRMSEVVGDRYCNGSSTRNLFISHGRVFLLRRELKSSTMHGHRSSVIHFPPPKVARLLIYYLVIVRPLEIFLTGSLDWTNEHTAYSEFIYVMKGVPLTPRRFSDIIASYSESYFGCRLSGMDLRHVFINIQTTFLPPIPDPSCQRFGDSQAGHSTGTALRIYGQREDDLPGFEALCFVLSYHWCNRLHRVLGVGPDPPSPPIPYLHAPSEPTWWSPSQFIPQPVVPENLINNMHHHITTTLLGAVDKVSVVCQQSLREAMFEGLALLSSTHPPPFPSRPFSKPQPMAVSDVCEAQTVAEGLDQPMIVSDACVPQPAAVSFKICRVRRDPR